MWHRRHFLKAAGAAMAGVALALGSAFADAVPTIAYESVPDLVQMPPDTFLGECSGVAVNSKGHLFIFSRGNTTGPAYGAAAAQLLEFGPDGRFVREIGHNFYAWSFAHTVKVDAADNVWVTDKGSDLVIKFTPRAASRWCSAASRRQRTSSRGR